MIFFNMCFYINIIKFKGRKIKNFSTYFNFLIFKIFAHPRPYLISSNENCNA